MQALIQREYTPDRKAPKPSHGLPQYPNHPEPILDFIRTTMGHATERSIDL